MLIFVCFSRQPTLLDSVASFTSLSGNSGYNVSLVFKGFAIMFGFTHPGSAPLRSWSGTWVVVYIAVELSRALLCFLGTVWHSLEVSLGLTSVHTRNWGILFSTPILSEIPHTLSSLLGSLLLDPLVRKTGFSQVLAPYSVMYFHTTEAAFGSKAAK